MSVEIIFMDSSEAVRLECQHRLVHETCLTLRQDGTIIASPLRHIHLFFVRPSIPCGGAEEGKETDDGEAAQDLVVDPVQVQAGPVERPQRVWRADTVALEAVCPEVRQELRFGRRSSRPAGR